MRNFFYINFFAGNDFNNPFNGEHSADDLFGITESYGLIEIPNTPSLQIINGFLTVEDANKIYDYDC